VNLKTVIKQEAFRLGFTLAGVTTCDPLPHLDVFETWLEEGRQGEMSYLATPRSRLCRSRPQELLAGCRSVLVLGMRYPAPLPIKAMDSNRLQARGKIAAYAWGVDYHTFLSGRLQSLVRFIEAQVGQPVLNRWYTDTGPILERELATRAGLGWIGKNTCLINPRHGSYFLLAEILLGIDLEPDQPFTPDRCGACTRCLQACPTHCILPDRTLDARRCISYLTIELKGPIPSELRHELGSWVFGCDVCQQVCPWNHFATTPVDEAFTPQVAQPEPDLGLELALSAAGFSQKYRHSPIRRTKRGGYLRNIAVALGNLGHQNAINPLIRSLQSDPEALVRQHVAWALGQVGGPVARRALQQAKRDEADLQVLMEIEKSLE
jgi:epoxyqueuosine reductase